MAAPIWGQPPKIRQEGASLVVYDNASWFTQGEPPQRATRYVHVWFWNGVNVFSTPPPPWRSAPERVQPGEGAYWIPLGPTNIGGEFHVVEFGGVESPAYGDEPAWTEWGREQSSRPGVVNPPRSEPVRVEPWDIEPPPPPPPPSGATGDELARRGFADLQRAVVYWAENGLKPGEIEATRAWIALRMKLLPKDSAKLAEIRRLLA